MSSIASSSTQRPRRLMNKPNWIITSAEVEQGSILWLGTPEETAAAQQRRGVEPYEIPNAQTGKPANEGMYEHPILVVSRPASNPHLLYFMSMTSHGNKSIQQKYQGRKSTYHQETFVPIAPAVEHPRYIRGDPDYRTLTLVNDGQLERSTYVNVKELYVMDFRDAQLYWGADATLRRQWKLDRASIQTVVELARRNVGLNPQPQFCPNERQSPQSSPVRGDVANVPSSSTVRQQPLPLGLDIPIFPVTHVIQSASAPASLNESPPPGPTPTSSPAELRSKSAPAALNYYPTPVRSPPVPPQPRQEIVEPNVVVETSEDRSRACNYDDSSPEAQIREPLLSPHSSRNHSSSPRSSSDSDSDSNQYCLPSRCYACIPLRRYDIFRIVRGSRRHQELHQHE